MKQVYDLSGGQRFRQIRVDDESGRAQGILSLFYEDARFGRNPKPASLIVQVSKCSPGLNLRVEEV